MSRSLVAPGVLALGSLALLGNALAGGDLTDLPPLLLLLAAAGYATGASATPSVAGAAVAISASMVTAANQIVAPGDYPVLDDLVFYLLAIGGPALAGAALAGRARQVRELQRLAGVIIAQREAEVRLAQAEERTRVEVGLHRRFSEDLAAIVMRAESVRDGSPDDVRRALAEVEATARGSLDRLREALGTLREPTERRPAEPPTDLPDRRSRPSPTRRISRIDVALGATCGAAMAVETLVSSAASGPVTANVTVALAVGGVTTLARTRPLLTAGGLLVGFTVMSLLLTPSTELVSALLPLTAVAYGLGAHARGPVRWGGAVLLGAGLALLEPVGTEGEEDGVLPLLVWVALAVLAGVATAGRTARARQLAAYVEELERGRDVEVQLATAEQRGRLAHDLHDTVAHALTVVCLQASSAQVDPAPHTGVLEVVADAGRTGLAELRDGLDGLGDAQALAAEEIAGQARRAGVHPEVRVVGAVDALPPEVRLLAARVSREALTNAGRYAPGARVTVSLEIGDTVSLDVHDSGGSGSAWAHGAGTGLQALREDVERAGGTLDWGLTPKGFRVRATLPVAGVTV